MEEMRWMIDCHPYLTGEVNGWGGGGEPEAALPRVDVEAGGPVHRGPGVMLGQPVGIHAPVARALHCKAKENIKSGQFLWWIPNLRRLAGVAGDHFYVKVCLIWLKKEDTQVKFHRYSLLCLFFTRTIVKFQDIENTGS